MVCPICSNANATNKQQVSDSIRVECPQCGSFELSNTASYLLENPKNFANDRWKISAWVYEVNPEFISSTDLETASVCATPSLHQRAEKMLHWISKVFPPGSLFSLNDLGAWESYTSTFIIGGELTSSRLVPIGWNKTIAEMLFMVTEVLCNEMGLLVSQNNHEYQVSPKGLLYLEGRRESASSVGFCAMWFNPSVRFIYDEAISKAIKDAGYEPFRVDGKEHNNRIDDEIVANIKSAKFMVADLTGHRGGVYYEAGLAHGLGLEVIFTCKEKRATHFDIRQYNTIFWNPDNMPDFREKIKNRILASSIGRGPLDPNRA